MPLHGILKGIVFKVYFIFKYGIINRIVFKKGGTNDIRNNLQSLAPAY